MLSHVNMLMVKLITIDDVINTNYSIPSEAEWYHKSNEAKNHDIL